MRVRLITSIVATQFAFALAGCAGTQPRHAEDEIIEAHERVPPVPQRVLEAFRRDYPGVNAFDADHQRTGYGPIVYRFRFSGRAGTEEAFFYYNGRRATPDVWRDNERPRETPVPNLVP